MFSLMLFYGLLCCIWNFLLKNKYSSGVIANFVLVLLISRCYGLETTQLGDDISYRKLAHDFDFNEVLQAFQNGDLTYVFFWLRNSGSYPTYWLLDYLGLEYTNGYLFLSGVIIHSFTMLLLYLIVLNKGLLGESDRRLLILLLTGPVILTLSAAPTRHMFTLSGLVLIYFFHERKTRYKVFTLIMLLLILGFSKPIYLAIYAVFVLFLNGGKLTRIIGVFLTIYFLKSEMVARYLLNPDFHFGLDLTNPLSLIFLYPLKLVYAAMGPFPHYNLAVNVRLFGENYLLYLMQLLSVVITCYAIISVSILILKRKIDSTLFLFIVLSLSIAGGSRSFHGYLSIFIPFILIKLPSRNMPLYLVAMLCVFSINFFWLLL